MALKACLRLKMVESVVTMCFYPTISFDFFTFQNIEIREKWYPLNEFFFEKSEISFYSCLKKKVGQHSSHCSGLLLIGKDDLGSTQTHPTPFELNNSEYLSAFFVENFRFTLTTNFGIWMLQRNLGFLLLRYMLTSFSIDSKSIKM